MKFSDFIKNIPTPMGKIVKSCLADYPLLEREGDKDFLNMATDIFNMFVEAVQDAPNAKIYDMSPLYFIFGYLDDGVGANFDSDKNTITVNISIDPAQYQQDRVGFVKDHKYQIVHEIIHFMDSIRMQLPKYTHRSNLTTADTSSIVSNILNNTPLPPPKAQINQPTEFNAYFHTMQRAYIDILNIVKEKPDKYKEFDREFGDNADKFINKFFGSMRTIISDKTAVDEIMSNEVYKRKWIIRICQLYMNLKRWLMSSNPTK